MLTVNSMDQISRWQQDPVCAYVIRGVAGGTLKPGQKLPTERELCASFHQSRSSVRKSLAVLEGNGLIIRHVGRGTFVTDPGASKSSGQLDSPTVPDVSPVQLIEARMTIEPSLASLATQHATNADLREIVRWHELGCAATDHEKFEEADRELHLALARASHNPLLIAAMEMIDRARNSTEWGSMKRRRHSDNPGRGQTAVEEHTAIVNALRERDAKAASEATRHHLREVRNNLIGR